MPETSATVAARPAIVAVGVAIASLAVKATVTVSPVFARVGAVLFDAMATAVRVGAVWSKVTPEVFVVAATVVPVLPVTSVNVSENVTAPSVSPAPIVTVAV